MQTKDTRGREKGGNNDPNWVAPWLRLPFHTHVGPGNTLDKSRLVNKLDEVAYEHDKQYGNPEVKTKDADNEFIGESLKELHKNPLAFAAVGGIAAKRYGADRITDTDKYLRKEMPGIPPNQRKKLKEQTQKEKEKDKKEGIKDRKQDQNQTRGNSQRI